MLSSERRITLHNLSTYKRFKSRDYGGTIVWIAQNRCAWVLGATFCLLIVIRQTFFPWPAYSSRAEKDYRQYRFPSVNDRVKIYMGDWFHPPCREDLRIRPFFRHDRGTIELNEISLTDSSRKLAIRSQVDVSLLFYFDHDALAACSRKSWPIGPYCSEALSTVDMAKRHVGWNNQIPILMQFGDEAHTRAYDEDSSHLLLNPILPHIMKFRALKPKEDAVEALVGSSKSHCNGLRSLDVQPIIWKLNAKRHYRDLYLVPRNDRPWSQKIDKAVFRGAATGKGLQNRTLDCHELQRCQLVHTHASSKLIDAKLTKLLGQLPETIDGVELLGTEYTLRQMLRHKGIVMLEGNDVSSGLKWALLSQSVVLMPEPTYTSWAMEELLEPWVHYIPLKWDLSNVEAMVLWMLDHQDEAQRISHRASLWIMDLVFHPDSAIDDQRIYEEILKRYAAYFQT